MSVTYFYLGSLSFFAGVFCSTLFSWSLSVITWLTLVGFILFLIGYRAKVLHPTVTSVWGVGILIIIFSLGALRFELAKADFGTSALTESVGQEIIIEGIIKKFPDSRETSTFLEVKTPTDTVLVSTDRFQEFSYGDKVKVSGELSVPESFETDLGRTFNYPGYLQARGIEYSLSFATVEVLEKKQGNKIITILFNFKTAFMKKIEAVIPEPAAGLGEGLLLGVKQALGEELEAAFRKTGIIHIVVLSGYNIMLVVIFFMYILKAFFDKRLRMVGALTAILGFAILVGFSATVVRASLMAALLIIVQTTNRNYLALRGLMIAGLLMTIINPFLLVYDVGFQLSFLATLGLILIAPHLQAWFYKLPNFLNVQMFLVSTLATQLAVLPLLLYQIGEFSVVSVLVNVLVLPMVPVSMLLVFITGLASFIFLPLGMILAIPTYWSLTYINQVALLFAKLPFAAYAVPAFSFYLVIIIYDGVGFWLWKKYQPGLGNAALELSEKTLKTQVQVTLPSDKFSDWEIEAEEVEPESKKDGVRRTPSLPDPEVPIFFR